MEGWTAASGLSVELNVNCHTHQSGLQCLVEESDEQLRGDECRDGNEDQWNPNRLQLVRVLDALAHDQPTRTHVEAGDQKHTNQDEHTCKDVSEVELHQVLQVHEESIPGALTVWIT